MSTLTIDERGNEVLIAQHTHLDALGRYYGPRSPEYVDAMTSLTRCWAALLARSMSGAARVSRDGALSLYVVDGIHYGIIWHETRRTCTTCGALLNEEGKTSWSSVGRPQCEPGTHVPDYPYDAPSKGTWSMHS